MQTQDLVQQLHESRQYFEKTLSVLTEEDSSFAPREGMMTVAQQVLHVAGTVDWFVEGAFRPEGFDMDFESHEALLAKATSLGAMRAELGRAFDRAIEVFGSKSVEELDSALPEGMVMGGQPRWAVVGAIEDHTAHHRGSLAVYVRLLGREPVMPYL